MGITALRKLLKSLCNNSCWKYAVLWKLRPGTPMILTWEDGYFDHPKPREPVESTSDNIYCSGAGGIHSSQFETSTSGCSSEGCQIGLVVSDLSHLQYTLGEGVVGKVACSGIHSWVCVSDILTSEVNPRFVPECPQEWLLHFASGIKTILLIPVLPYGVLQLGSSEEVTEDIEIVACIKHLCGGLHSFGENPVPLISKRDLKAQASSLLMPSPAGYSDAPSVIEVSLVKCEQSNDSMAVNGPNLPRDNLLGAFEYESKTKDDLLQFCLAEVPTPNEPMNGSRLDTVESKLFELSSLMEELQAYTDLNGCDVELFAESLNEITNSCPAGEMQRTLHRVEAANDLCHRNRSSFLNFPKDSELHKALGSAFQTQADEKLWDFSFSVEDCSNSRLIRSKHSGEETGPSRLTRGNDAEYQLDDVIASAFNGSDHTSSYTSNSPKSLISASEHFAGSSQPQNEGEVSGMVENDPERRHLTFACISGDTDSTTVDGLNSKMSTIHKEQQERRYNHMQLRKGRKMSNASRKKVRPGDNQRPRPRDRQLIQDRVKELRELVPNGEKCSIDGLLDRTIKHMLYLRSVADQADKLRQSVHQEVTSPTSTAPSHINNNNLHGTSWAFEYGSEFQLCPIIVEDLAYPGHMVIEMRCNDHGLFLEIAQVIRGLGLTILKGTIKRQSSNTCAHFIVEACKGFHRLDIFWPLMQLLQRRKSPLSSRI